MFWRKKFIPRNAESISWAKEIYVGGIGPLPSRLMAVGQCPGFGEATASPPAPFQESAPAGGELNVYLQQAGLKRDEFYITNEITRNGKKGGSGSSAPYEPVKET